MDARLFLAALSGLLSACVSSAATTGFGGTSPAELCEAYNRQHFTARGLETKYDAIEELERRGIFSSRDIEAIRGRSVYIGMPRAALQCAWGRPSVVNRTLTANGETLQLVYESYSGRNRYVYIENDRVRAVQD